MALPEDYKGYALAVASYLTQAVGSIGSKLLINATSVETASVFWYVAGTVMSFSMLQFRRGGINWLSLRRNAAAYLQVSLIMAVAGLGWFVGLKLAGPGIVAFVQQLATVMGVLLGAFVLGERIRLVDGLGIVLAITGALIITYRSTEVVTLGIAAALVNTFGLAIQSFLVKRSAGTIDSFELLFVRSVVALLIIPLFFAATGGFEWPSLWLIPWFFAGSFIGYILFNLLLYIALSYADLIKVSVLRAITPPTAMIGAYLMWGTVPTPAQIVGGVLILFGVSLILVQPLLTSADREMNTTTNESDLRHS